MAREADGTTRPETRAALVAVARALAVAAARMGRSVVTSKGGRDLVTDADVSAEDVVRAVLAETAPGCPVVGEERGGAAPADGRPYWLVDPICGTRNFASSVPLFSVNVALVEEGRVTVAAVGDGSTGERYAAERGRGAWLDAGGAASPVRPSSESRVLAIDMGLVVAPAEQVQAAAVIGSAALGGRWHVRMLGTTLTLVHAAGGRVAAYVLLASPGPLHFAAGCLVAEEAGALVTDLDGRPWSLDTRSFLVASTVALQHELLAILQGAR